MSKEKLGISTGKGFHTDIEKAEKLIDCKSKDKTTEITRVGMALPTNFDCFAVFETDTNGQETGRIRKVHRDHAKVGLAEKANTATNATNATNATKAGYLENEGCVYGRRLLWKPTVLTNLIYCPMITQEEQSKDLGENLEEKFLIIEIAITTGDFYGAKNAGKTRTLPFNALKNAYEGTVISGNSYSIDIMGATATFCVSGTELYYSRTYDASVDKDPKFYIVGIYEEL